MKFLPLIWRNALRNRLRTFLTLAGIAFLLFVLIFVLTALTEMQAWEGVAAPHLRVVVQHAEGLTALLTIDLENYLKSDEIQRHAKNVTKFNWYGGYYQDRDNLLPEFAVDVGVIRELFTELRFSDDAYRRLLATKNGTLVGVGLMKKFGWEVGRKITLIGTFYPANPELEIVGTFTATDPHQEVQMFFRWDYFDELMNQQKMVSTYWMEARTLEDIPKLKELIDAHTKNSPAPTETVTEREFAAQFSAMMGNVKAIVTGIGMIVLLIMVMMTANTMAMAARERVTEVAVMRTLGFSGAGILAILVAESILVSLIGAAFAVGVSLAIFNVLRLSPNPVYFPVFMVETSTVLVALGAALFCGVFSSLVPAIRSARRKISDGLRQVV
ncbi:MAG TPA: FtsX-like permease family protein [Planctomycetota bacterium]|nr:FtsX-like permease family protein [Planctomycetota bacterium]